MKPKSILRLSVLTTFAFAASAHAVTYNWIGTTSDFDEPTNWVENAWTQWGDYHFGTDAVSGAVNLDALFGGGNWYLDSGLAHDITVTGTQPLVSQSAEGNGGNITIDTASKDLDIQVGYISYGPVTWNVGAGRTLTMTGAFDNWYAPASLVKQGSGTAILKSANGHSLGTTLNGGTLRLENTGALGTGGLSMANATTLQLRSDTDATFAGGDGLAGIGYASITFDVNQLTSGNSNKTLSFATGGVDIYSTTINVTGGNGYTLALGGINNGYNGPLTLNADTANLSIGNIGSASATSSLNVGGDATTTITGAVNTSGNFTKIGSGTLNLTGTSSFATAMIFAGGIVNAATFADNGTNSSLGAGTGDTDPNAIGLVLRGGTLQYTGSTAQSTDRAIRLSTTGGGGTIDASGSNPAATLSFTASSSPNFFENPGDRTLTLTGSNTGDNTFAMAIGETGGTTSLVKSGEGKWILTGANTYSGSTTVSGGILSITNPVLDDGSSVVIDSGAKLNLDFSGNDIVGNLDINGSGPLPAGIYNSSTLTYGSYFTGTGSLEVLPIANGTWTSLVDGNWEDAPNWNANTIANGSDQTATFGTATGATVTLSGSKTIGNLAFAVSDYTLAGSGTLTLDSSGIPGIGVTSGNTATIDANLGGTLGLEKTGDGTLILTGTKSYTGGTTVTGGTLELSGGTAGNSQINGSLTVSPGATVSITNGDGTGFGWNGPVTAITVNGGNLIAVSGSHLGFASMSFSLENGSLVDGTWQWNGDTTLSFSSSGASTNTISGLINLRGDSSLDHTFYVDDGAATTDLLVSANLDDRYSAPSFLWERSNLIKSGPGTMVLSGANTCYGNTVVNEGVLEVTADGSLRFGPTTNGTTNSVSGSATATLSFLGTVDLDLTAADTTTGNLWNLFNLGSFSTTPDLSAITAVTSDLGAFTESPVGTWELPVTGAKWVFTEADGNLAYVVTATDYDTWKSDNGVTGGENDDDDADGLTNHEEYAFGLDPTGGSSVNPITVQLSKTNGQFTYQRRDNGLTGLNYTVWYSTDLNVWTEDSGALQPDGTPDGNGVELINVTLSTLPGNPLPAKLFIQVRAE